MKNLNIAKKFLVAFGLILVLFLISVIATCSGIAVARDSYAGFYEEDYSAITNLYEMRLEQRRMLGQTMLAVDSDDVTPQEASATLSTYRADLEENLNWLKNSYNGKGDLSRLGEFETSMQACYDIADRALAALEDGGEAGTEEARNIVVNEYSPAVEESVAVLADIFNGMEELCSNNFNNTYRLLLSLLILGIVIAAVAFFITLFIAIKLSAGITAPVKLIEQAMKEVVKGNLSVDVPYESGDEFGSMAESMREVTTGVSTIVKDIEHCLGAMAGGDFTVTSSAIELYVGDYQKIVHSMRMIKDNFNSTLSTLNRSADQVSSGSDQVSSGAQALSQGATEQASSVEELAASINDISGHINTNAQNAQDASDKAIQVGEKAGESNDRMRDMLKAMEDINSSSGEIGKIIKTIEDIAFQTNILALNAAVEAARAGAAGKGFAVVADEVRNLASKSAEASKNTAALIENSLQAVEHGTKIADETARSLEVVISDIQETSTMMDTIARTSQEQAEAISQITLGIDQISSVVQTNSATAEQSAAASEELSGQAQILKDLVRKFRLEEDAAIPQIPQYDAPVSAGCDDMGSASYSYGGNDKY